MSEHAASWSRRRFLKGALQTSALLAAPQIVSSVALGKDGAVPPSERITLGGLGIGNRGGYDLGCFLNEADVRCLAICDVRRERRERAKKMVDSRYGNSDCKLYIDFRELLAREDIDAVLIATGPNWHVTASIAAARAGKDVYCEKPCTKNIAQSLALAEVYQRTGRVFQGGMQRRDLPHFQYAVDLAHTGKLGKLTEVHAQPAGMRTYMSGWLPAQEQPPREEVDWDMYLGPAAWRPYNRAMLDGFNFEKGGGLTGGGILEWGSHCVDLCQWAAGADDTAPVTYEPIVDKRASAYYASGIKLVIRDDGWLNSGSCPARFVGETGWVETGDSGDIFASSPALLAGRGAKVGGYPANNHIRNFLDCVKTRGLPSANHFVTCNTHIACHAVNVCLALNRKLTLDPKTWRFVNDDEANRFRSEAIRDPWRL